MAQQLTEDMTTSSLQETQKQRKKLVKRESKLRLQVEQAKGDVQKAERKIAKARIDFEVASARLHTLENELSKMHEASESN